jgi:hypothetical protein
MYVPKRYTIKAKSVNQRRFFRSVAFENVEKLKLAASCSAADAISVSHQPQISGW